MVDFRTRLNELLSEASESDSMIASNIGVSKQTISAWKNGTRSPKRHMIEYIANYFGVNVAWLMGLDVSRDPAIAPPPARNLIPMSQMPRHRVPLIGSVAAGEPILADESFDVFVDAPPKADYALKVEGDSMEPSFYNGDIVFIREQNDVDNGRVAVVLIDDSATLKHIYKKKDGVLLTSDNPKWEPMFKSFAQYDYIKILGVPVGYTRMFDGHNKP